MSIVIQVSSHQGFTQWLPFLPDIQEYFCLCPIHGSLSPCDLLMPPGAFASSNVFRLEQKLVSLHLTRWYLFLPCSSSCKEQLLIQGMSLLSELQLVGRMGAVELCHEIELFFLMGAMKSRIWCGQGNLHS